MSTEEYAVKLATAFVDRASAGAALAAALFAYRDRADVLVLGLPRGGVPVAAEVANALHAPLDIVVVRKLGARGQPELATGATMLAAVRAARKQGAKHVVVALPVASDGAMRALGNEADEVHCLLTPPSFRAVGEWYERFEQTTDTEVSSLLSQALRHQ
jgi:predicted phosphoribosyltransferase